MTESIPVTTTPSPLRTILLKRMLRLLLSLKDVSNDLLLMTPVEYVREETFGSTLPDNIVSSARLALNDAKALRMLKFAQL